MVIEQVGVRRLQPADYDQRISPRVRGLTEIVGFRGPFSPLASFARRIGAAYEAENRSFFPYRIFLVRRELRAWLRPFRGVSTHRLNNYLEWFRRRPDEPPWAPTTPADRALW